MPLLQRCGAVGDPKMFGGTSLGRLILALAMSLLLAACERPSEPPSAVVPQDDVQPFTGTWSATGNRQTLQLAAGHRVAIFKVSGSLLLTGKQRPHLGFKADVIGFSDTLSGLQGRSVWTDEHGEQAFSELRGEEVGPGKLVQGRFIGGTGRYQGVSGEYTFTWQYLVDNEDGEVSGRVVGLKGWARLGSPGAVSAQKGTR
jgi:hypothetical protein